jgi:hypothetical protein
MEFTRIHYPAEDLLWFYLEQRNAGRQTRFAEERSMLRPLPSAWLESYKRARV